jgi:hypothetical protein
MTERFGNDAGVSRRRLTLAMQGLIQVNERRLGTGHIVVYPGTDEELS